MTGSFDSSIVFNAVVPVEAKRDSLWQVCLQPIDSARIAVQKTGHYIFYREKGDLIGLLIENPEQNETQLKLRKIILQNTLGANFSSAKADEIIASIPALPLMNGDEEALSHLEFIASRASTYRVDTSSYAIDDNPDVDLVDLSVYHIKNPDLTITLIIINVIVFVLTRTDTSWLVWGAANSAGIYERGQLYRLVTSMFMHLDAFHLVGNMFVLFVIGAVVENMFGHRRFLFFYLGGGILAAATSTLINGASVNSIGASSAIFAVFGAEVVGLFLYRKHLSFRMHDSFKNIFITGASLSAVAFSLTVSYYANLNLAETISSAGYTLAGAAIGSSIGFFIMRRLFSRWAIGFVIWQVLYFGLILIPGVELGIRIDYWGHATGFIAGAILAIAVAPILLGVEEQGEKIYLMIRDRVNSISLSRVLAGVVVVLLLTVFVSRLWLFTNVTVSLPDDWVVIEVGESDLRSRCSNVHCFVAAKSKSAVFMNLLVYGLYDSRNSGISLREYQIGLANEYMAQGYTVLVSKIIDVDGQTILEVTYEDTHYRTMEIYKLTSDGPIVVQAQGLKRTFERHKDILESLKQHIALNLY